MIRFETSVQIRRPVDEVFGMVADPLRFPLWNSAVSAVHSRGGRAGEVGSTYWMERELPTGRAENDLEVFARDRPGRFAIRTTSGPTPFSYSYRFDPAPDGTVVHLDAEVEMPRTAAFLGPIARPAIKRGVEANFDVLKRLLESAPSSPARALFA